MAEADPHFMGETTIADEPKPTLPKRLLKIALMLSVPLLLAFAANYYYTANAHFVTTDNAYVQQDKVSVSAEISGRIVEVGVRENQHVKAGDLLFRIDPEPYRIAIAQAEASIAAAQVNEVSLNTEVFTSGIDIASAREDVKFYTEEFRRQSTLMEQGFTTRARLQAAEHALSDARSKVSIAEADAQKARAAAAPARSAPGVNPGVLAGEVQKRKALYDLSKADVYAPVSGTISQSERLQVGQMMALALPALSIVVDDKSWIEANFKETDLAKMRVGQPVDIWFDAYPSLKLKGKVASIGAGTGSEFSVLPAQNANGNWVKVTQRVPVRISINGKPNRKLIAGLSTHVRIDTSK
jgi:membrane fusion protein (multidrug efflux system)